MSRSTNILRYSAAVLSLGFAYLGIEGWWNQWVHCDTLARELQTASQLAYGALAAAIGLFVLMKRPVPRVLEWAWALATTTAAGMAPVVWGGAGVFAGMAGAVMGLLLALGVIWLARRGNRPVSGGS